MIGIIILTGLALILGVILVTVEQKLNCNDKKEEQFSKLLPGYNCGACGFGSCDGMAKAMLENVDNYKKCKPLRGELLKEMETYIQKIKN